MYRALAFHGGGVRGAMSAAIVEKLSFIHPGLVTGANLLTGTSTGALIALGLAAGKAPSELVELYEKEARAIFSRSRWRILGRWGVLEPRYRANGLRDILESVFGETLMGELGKQVLVPAVDATDPLGWRPKVWCNAPGDPDCLVSVVDVALATSAAPTYLPAHKIGGRLYRDGGLGANDPTLIAISHAARLGHARKEIRVLSFGTGRPIRVDPEEVRRPRETATTILRQVIGGIMQVTEVYADYHARHQLGDGYFQIQPDLGTSIRLDDAKAIPGLILRGYTFDLRQALRWVDSEWESGDG